MLTAKSEDVTALLSASGTTCNVALHIDYLQLPSLHPES